MRDLPQICEDARLGACRVVRVLATGCGRLFGGRRNWQRGLDQYHYEGAYQDSPGHLRLLYEAANSAAILGRFASIFLAVMSNESNEINNEKV
jgi:hypothetical protein